MKNKFFKLIFSMDFGEGSKAEVLSLRPSPEAVSKYTIFAGNSTYATMAVCFVFFSCMLLKEEWTMKLLWCQCGVINFMLSDSFAWNGNEEQM